MRRLIRVLATIGLPLLAAACSTSRPAPETPPLAFAPERPAAGSFLKSPGSSLSSPAFSGSLAGRTIRVSRISDIRLGPKEVVLTFDDGPMPGKTPAILGTLDRFGVKATFLMVGQMARVHPAIARQVAARGHSVGTHTQNHANLRSRSFASAVKEIDEGRRSVSGALGPSSGRASVFFRFPYLADTAALRAHLAANGMVAIDSQVDSKDYFQSSPDQVRQRILSRLGSKGSGIILMHDIHQRTVTMLPGLLADLKARGFKVVHLVPGRAGGQLIASAQ
jgi:peptidoglycan/xylan/chitin deacetylase (PgdA/CDA1 family)